MIQWCAYCQKFQGEITPFDNYAVTHGMCAKCKVRGLEYSTEEFEKIKELAHYQKVLFSAGRSQDHKLANEAIESARRSGVQPVELLMGVIAPLLWQIGDLWAAGSITVADEHRFTTFFDAIIERIEIEDGATSLQETLPNFDILLVNAPSNFHFLGYRIMNIWLKSKGIRSAALTEKYTLSSLILNIDKLKPKIVGISVAMAEQLPATIKLCEQLRFRMPSNCPSIVIGGNIVKQGAFENRDDLIFIFDLCQFLEFIRKKLCS